MVFGRSFTQKRLFGGLKMQTFENYFESASWKDTVIVSV